MPTATSTTALAFIHKCKAEAQHRADQGQEDQHAFSELRAQVLSVFERYALQRDERTVGTDLIMIGAELHAIAVAAFFQTASQVQKMLYTQASEDTRDAAVVLTLAFLQDSAAPGTASASD